MTNYLTLLNIYHQLDTVYAGVILLALAVVGTAHLVDHFTATHARIILAFYWGLVVLVYVAGIIFVGLNFSN